MLRVGMIALLAALLRLAAWRWAPPAAWIFMLPVAVLTVGTAGAGLGLEPGAGTLRGAMPAPPPRSMACSR